MKTGTIMRYLINIMIATLTLWSSLSFSYNNAVKKYQPTKTKKEKETTFQKTKCFKLYLKKSFISAMQTCRHLSKKNDPDAQYLIAKMYHHGDGVNKNLLTAKRWYLKSAKNGQAKAQTVIASMYLLGFYMKRNVKKSMYWYTRAAKQGFAPAQYVLSSLYRVLAKKNTPLYSQMFYWLQKAIDQNYPPALFEMAKCYYFGVGVRINDKKAFNFMKRAAEKGFAAAYYPLGKMYEYGHGIGFNLNKALFWYKKSANTKQKMSNRLRRSASYKVMLLSPNR